MTAFDDPKIVVFWDIFRAKYPQYQTKLKTQAAAGELPKANLLADLSAFDRDFNSIDEV